MEKVKTYQNMREFVMSLDFVQLDHLLYEIKTRMIHCSAIPQAQAGPHYRHASQHIQKAQSQLKQAVKIEYGDR